MKMKNRSHRYDVNRPRSRHEHKYCKCKGLSMMTLICVKQHLSDIWSSIHEKVKQNRVCWKKALLIKKSEQLKISFGKKNWGCSTDVFLWILRNFWEHILCRTSAKGCFYWFSFHYFSNFPHIFYRSLSRFPLVWTWDYFRFYNLRLQIW